MDTAMRPKKSKRTTAANRKPVVFVKSILVCGTQCSSNHSHDHSTHAAAKAAHTQLLQHLAGK